MPKQYNIKWREIDSQKARKAIRNFNAKIDYQRRTHPERAEALPDKITLKEFKQNVATRDDFNRQIQRLQNFSKRGAETVIQSAAGEFATVWEVQETKKAISRINRQRKEAEKRLEKTAVYVNGKKLENAFLSEKRKRLTEIKFNFTGQDFNKSFKDFAKWAEHEQSDKRKQETDINYYNNFIATCHKKFMLEDVQKIKAAIDKIGIARFEELRELGYEELEIDWVYYEPIDSDTKVQRILTILAL